jgi:hypothetical protein
MTTLIKNLEKELAKSTINSQKLEQKYYASKNEKNDYDGCMDIYKKLKKSWEVSSIIETALTQLKNRI